LPEEASLSEAPLDKNVDINIYGRMDPVLDPRDFAATCLCLAVRRAARAVARRYDQAFEGLGINNGQFTILMSLSAERDIGMSQVAQELGMDRTTLTAALKPMERDGLVTSSRDAGDRRSRLLAITAKGRALLKKAVPRWRRTQDELIRAGVLGDPDRLRALLKAMA
jgi:DNA-binding MarR family transcriptional regulator